ncbi:MAG TPA: acyl-ACP thioesterase domain-containing protein [Bacteroidales bacterium]|nr:acyl-ACP thioesterase domain-containing protein [Bacteroidales bacterium]
MDEIKKIGSDQYTVNWFETDAYNGASLVAISNFLQVSAFRHARSLGFDYTRKDGFDALWVLVRMLIRMDKYPKWEDKVTIKTWHRGTEGLMALRDYEILDDEGGRLGAVSSSWFLLDPVTRKAIVPELSDENQSTIHPEKVMEENPERILIRGDLPHIRTITAGYTDLDMYRHVNNSRYVDWILNSFPNEMHRQYVISGFLIEFLSEVLYQEEVKIFASIDPVCSLVKGVRNGDEKTIFRARIEWKKR